MNEQSTVGQVGQARPQRVSDEELDNRFLYHRPTPEAQRRHERISQLFLEVAKELRDLTPYSREQSVMFTVLEDCRMRANAAVACNHDKL